MAEQRPSPVPLLVFLSPAQRALRRARSSHAGSSIPTTRTHALVRENLHRSPLYGLDLIRGIGPRYCPSIEDKVVKFAHNPTHQIFIEPEGWDEPTFYVGGFSTSLPGRRAARDAAHAPGLRSGAHAARRLRRRVRLRASRPSWTRRSRRAASRASSTAARSTARRATRRPPRRAWSPASTRPGARTAASRCASAATSPTSACSIDDLVTRGVDEPYRMLTSRAEHRVRPAPRQRRPAPDPDSAATSAWSTTRPGPPSPPAAKPWPKRTAPRKKPASARSRWSAPCCRPGTRRPRLRARRPTRLIPRQLACPRSSRRPSPPGSDRHRCAGPLPARHRPRDRGPGRDRAQDGRLRPPPADRDRPRRPRRGRALSPPTSTTARSGPSRSKPARS